KGMGNSSDEIRGSRDQTSPATATAARPDGPGAPGPEADPAPRARGSNSRLARLIRRMTGGSEEDFVLQIVQPSLVGLIDGTVSTLAPIFAAAVSTNSRTALLVGIATALGAGVSMGMSEALSDTGEITNRGSALVRGIITGGATALGGIFHSLPFLIGNVNRALVVAGIVVGIELFVIAWVRYKFLHVSLRSSLIVVTLGGAIVLGIGVLVGSS
ncbi:MAG: erythrin-vacuolar iron transport family protein, partial [Solirubrobacteraceae bacterium]|nr:erythrin-vacuolar iron transport family protein [Solirubrobacteraceae bacterium]